MAHNHSNFSLGGGLAEKLLDEFEVGETAEVVFKVVITELSMRDALDHIFESDEPSSKKPPKPKKTFYVRGDITSAKKA